jgi:hypothetical protein
LYWRLLVPAIVLTPQFWRSQQSITQCAVEFPDPQGNGNLVVIASPEHVCVTDALLSNHIEQSGQYMHMLARLQRFWPWRDYGWSNLCELMP